MVTCDEVVDRLPWLLNGSLEGEEREAVRAHVATCSGCRRDLEETRQAFAVFGAHLPSATLVDLAWERPVTGLPPGLAKRHLESCPQCAEELALAQESRRLEAKADVPRPAGHRSAVVRFAEWGGSLAAGLLLGLWWGGAVERRPLPAPPGTSPGPPPERHAARPDQEEELQRLRAPEPNLPIFELLPSDHVERSGGAAREVVVPSSARLVALLLASEPGARSADLEIRSAGGETVWSGAGLVPGPLGAYSIGVPSALLPDGRYELVLRPVGGRASRYEIHVRRSPPTAPRSGRP
jgi:hypothetical protein